MWLNKKIWFKIVSLWLPWTGWWFGLWNFMLSQMFGATIYQCRLCTKKSVVLLSQGRATVYFGGARSKGFATLRNVWKLQFFDKIGHAKSVGFRFYSAIWRSESRISSRYLEITSISLIYSLTFSRKKELIFWLSRGLSRLTCVTRLIRGDSKLRD